LFLTGNVKNICIYLIFPSFFCSEIFFKSFKFKRISVVGIKKCSKTLFFPLLFLPVSPDFFDNCFSFLFSSFGDQPKRRFWKESDAKEQEEDVWHRSQDDAPFERDDHEHDQGEHEGHVLSQSVADGQSASPSGGRREKESFIKEAEEKFKVRSWKVSSKKV